MPRLFDTIDFVPPAFVHIDKVVALACQGDHEAIRGVFAYLEKAVRPYWAEADAARLAKAVLQGIKMARATDRTS